MTQEQVIMVNGNGFVVGLVCMVLERYSLRQTDFSN